MSHIKTAINEVRSTLPEGVTLVAVSKYHPTEAIEEAYSVGQRIFGESIVQHLRVKAETLPKDIRWHFIGHLQTNKVKYIAPFIAMIESVDSERLLIEIDRQAERCGRVIDVLLELHLAKEETKSGFDPEECLALLESGIATKLPHIHICGIMTMGTNTDDEALIASEFDKAYNFFTIIKQQFFSNSPYFTECSWGMSDDYLLAIKHHSNHVRVGSRIFK